MADIYTNLTYDEYKELEKQCKRFPETAHGEGTDYYHKSVRLKIGGVTWEFHGPVVKARQNVGSVPEGYTGAQTHGPDDAGQ